MRLAPFLLSWSSTNPHYGAVWIFPLSVLCAFGLQSLLAAQRLRIFAQIAAVVCLLGLAGVYLASFNRDTKLEWKYWTSYFDREFENRNQIVARLANSAGGGHLVFVKYGDRHNILREWVYNSPRIDHQEIVWAHDLGEERNFKLTNFYGAREVWRVEVRNSKTATLEKWDRSNGRFEFVKTFNQ
jgi:hypothetical protein